MVKNPPANAGVLRGANSVPGWGRSPGGGNGSPLQPCCLENPMDRGAWRATVSPWTGKISWRKKWQPTPVFLPGESHGQRSLVGYSPWGGKDFPGGSDSKASAYNVGDPGSIPGSGRSSGEGNDNPLQYSCLENPMDRGAW